MIFVGLINDEREKTVCQNFLKSEYPPSLQKAIARLVFQLCRDSPLIAFFPWNLSDKLTYYFKIIGAKDENLLDVGLDYISSFNAYIGSILRVSSSLKNSIANEELCDFFICLVEQVLKLHADDEPLPETSEIPMSYRPDTGVAYYFTESGNQVREAPTFEVDLKNPSLDVLDQRCSKKFPRVTKGGFSYMFIWLCPRHGHCYGYHLIPNAEGKKDPFYSLYKYCKNLPECVVYDASCQLHEYALNRMPSFARKIRFYDDAFHSFNHVNCANVYRVHDDVLLRYTNTSRAEQFNAYINCVKYTASHLTKIHFCVFLQFFLHRWNEKKTASYKECERFANRCNE